MGETANIAAMAEILSNKLFGVFGWKQHGPPNFNFTDDTGLKAKKKHPCDMIFGYSNPYGDDPEYLLTDLKSYMAQSVESKEKLETAIKGLASALTCSRKSLGFKRHLPDESGTINALLFIFNNDAKFDRDFPCLMEAKAPSNVQIPHNARLYVMGPPDIQFLCNIVNDLAKVYGEDVELAGQFKFFYPNLIGKIPAKNEWEAASPEMLLSKFIAVIYEKQKRTKEGEETVVTKEKHTNIYYRGEGSSPEEFCFLFDYCFRYSLIDDYKIINLKMPTAGENCLNNFEKAKHLFSEHFYKQDISFKKLEQIQLTIIEAVTVTFHEKNIGMEKRKEFAHAK